MKHTKFILLLLIISQVGFAQNLKNFSGAYPNEYGSNGVATYTYYIDTKTSNYVKHGPFKYTMKEGNNYNAVITGSFKNGKRDGLWNFNITCLDDPSDNVFYTGNVTLSANYTNGLPNGSWIYSNTMKYRGKVSIPGGGFRWGNYILQPTVNASANFMNGITVGAISIINGIGNYSIVKGNFNASGFLDKTWTLRSAREEDEMTFDNGIQTSFIAREIPSGKVFENDIDDEAMKKLKADFISKKISIKDLKTNRIKIDTVWAIKSIYNFQETFYNKIFNYDNIEGDETYQSGVNTRDDGYFFIFKRIENKTLSEIEDYKFAERDEEKIKNISDYEVVIEKYKSIISQFKSNLSDTDISILNKKIENLEKGQATAKRKNEYSRIEYYYSGKFGKNYEKCIKESNDFLENYKDVLTREEVEYIKDIIEKCKSSNNAKAVKTKRQELLTLIKDIEDSIIQFNNSLTTKYEFGHISEKFSIYETYKSIKNKFEEEVKTVQGDLSISDLSDKQIEKLVTLKSDFNFIASFIDNSEKSRLDSKLERASKNSKSIHEMKTIFADFK